MSKKTLGARCKLARGERTYAEIAREAGLSRDYPRHVESGLVTNPGTETLAKLASGLGVSFQWLATGDGPMRDAEAS